jgi:hypothetical protein
MALGYLPRIKHKSTTLCSALVSFFVYFVCFVVIVFSAP